MQRAFICGLSGTALSEAERGFLARARPAGLILFTRNCESAAQVRRLVCAFNDAVGSDRTLVLIDQEGGRVQRLRPPLARQLPPAAAFAALYNADPAMACRAARAVARLTADDLAAFRVNTNCVPVLDVPASGAHDIIGDRAYGTSPDSIIALGRAVAEGMMAGAILPVMKHIPGHGRAGADSHLELPVVDASEDDLLAADLVPFRALADLPAAMTAHVVFSRLDPQHPASTSALVTERLIRKSAGFQGLLLSDDLSMKALSGSLRSRAEAVLAAGSDLALHCNGDLAEMEEVADGAPALEGLSRRRFGAALAVTLAQREPYDVSEAETLLEQVLMACV